MNRLATTRGMGAARGGGMRRIVTALALTSATVLLAAAGAQARAASAPTLGLARTVHFGAGFGSVRPRTISYGGDPTSFVSQVRWRSWGGARAVGSGVAGWTWPGWCVACGTVQLRATVVAFGRTTCDGHRAYSHVEWFFPSRGMTFDRRLAGENLCTGAPGPGPSTREAHCGQVPLSSGAGGGRYRATAITMFGSPITCAAARGFVAASGAARYAGRDARFTVDGWWCGSLRSMAMTGPQSFTCVRGDFTNVIFNLAPG